MHACFSHVLVMQMSTTLAQQYTNAGLTAHVCWLCFLGEQAMMAQCLIKVVTTSRTVGQHNK